MNSNRRLTRASGKEVSTGIATSPKAGWPSARRTGRQQNTARRSGSIQQAPRARETTASEIWKPCGAVVSATKERSGQADDRGNERADPPTRDCGNDRERRQCPNKVSQFQSASCGPRGLRRLIRANLQRTEFTYDGRQLGMWHPL